MVEMVKHIYGEDYVVNETTVDGLDGRYLLLKIVVGDRTHCIDCLANEESFSEEYEGLRYDDVVRICKKLIDNSYQNQTFVFYDLLPEEERTKLNEWAKENGIEIKDMLEFISWFYMQQAEMNDILARENPDEWRKLLAKIFPDFVY